MAHQELNEGYSGEPFVDAYKLALQATLAQDASIFEMDELIPRQLWSAAVDRYVGFFFVSGTYSGTLEGLRQRGYGSGTPLPSSLESACLDTSATALKFSLPLLSEGLRTRQDLDAEQERLRRALEHLDAIQDPDFLGSLMLTLVCSSASVGGADGPTSD